MSSLLLTVMTCSSLTPLPFFQCVKNRDCGFADGFFEKMDKKRRERKRSQAVFRDRWWLVWLGLPLLPFDMTVCKDTNVHL